MLWKKLSWPTLSRKRLYAIGGAAVFVVIVVALLMLHTHNRLNSLKNGLGSDAHDNKHAQTLTVTTQTIQQQLHIIGRLAPGHMIAISAPFAGIVEASWIEYGESVKKGAQLLIINTAEIQPELWTAQNAMIDAQQAYNKVAQWDNSTTVLAAHQAFDEAQEELSLAQRKAKQMATLYEKGIISADDNASTIENLHTEERSFTSAKASLASTLAQGDKDYLEASRLTLQSAQHKLDVLQKQIKQATLYAPTAGIVIMPLKDDDESSSSTLQPQKITLGTHLELGEPIVDIADLSTYSATGEVDEIEVNKLKMGQPVTIKGNGFPNITLKGHVSLISQEAISSTSEGLAHFKVSVTIPDLTPAEKEKLRIGMTAHMGITTYVNKQAIVIPISAVHGDDAQHWVSVQNAGQQQAIQVKVKTGITTLNGIEIVDGLKAGDVVVVNNASKSN